MSFCVSPCACEFVRALLFPLVSAFFSLSLLAAIYSRTDFHLEGVNAALGESPPDDNFYEEEGHMPETSFAEPSNYYEVGQLATVRMFRTDAHL